MQEKFVFFIMGFVLSGVLIFENLWTNWKDYIHVMVINQISNIGKKQNKSIRRL